ncbi:MAG TPA: 30S ribosomal protein S16 [Chloroflexi bacterium]|nr:30S ribosomal protein S16 [Chloroflexota bacterium]
MVKIRLRRVGAKKQPSYRVVVADSRSPRDGRFIEVIGFYNPRTEPETVSIKEERALYWLSVGAQPTLAVERLLKNQGTLDRFERLKQGESLEALAAEAAQVLEVVEDVGLETRPEPATTEPEEEPELVETRDEVEEKALPAAEVVPEQEAIEAEEEGEDEEGEDEVTP